MNLLLVEDDDNDAELVVLAFQKAGIPIDLTRVENGDECLRYLRAEAPFQSASRPDLILLDINMPVKNGHEVMKELIEDDRLRSLPVIILTTSAAEKDINAMYDKRCSAYAIKPAGFTDFVELLKKLMAHWDKMALPE